MRRLIVFPCADDSLVATLDEGSGQTGLLIVSGGNEIRCGAHRGMALLAARLAADGIPVLRYDRRGIGDSTGENRGFRHAGPDLAAATAAFRQHAGVTRLVAFGNCDAATTIALHGRDAGIDRAILANPWVVERADDLPAPAAIRAHYRQRLRDPATWRRALTGGIGIGKLARGLSRAAAPAQDFTADAIAAIAAWGQNATVVLAVGDGTAIAYADAAHRAKLAVATVRIPTASHSFARVPDQQALESAIRAALG